MADTLDPKLIDKRTAARYLRSGLLDEKAYEKYLKTLPDLADRAMKVEADIGEDDFDDDEEDLDEEDAAPEGGV